MVEISVVMLNWNGRQHISKCLDSIYDNPPQVSFEVIVVDQGSIDGSAKMIGKKYPKVRLIKNAWNIGIAKATNAAFAATKGEFIFLLGNDTVVTHGWADNCMKIFDSDRRIGCIGSTLVGIDGLSTIKPEQKIRNVWSVSSQAMMLKRKAIENIGAYDEVNFNPYGGEETDWNYRLKNAGYRVALTRSSIVGHIGGADTKRQNPEREMLLCYGSLKAMLYNDSAFVFAMRLHHMIVMIINGLMKGTLIDVAKGYAKIFSELGMIWPERKKRSDKLLQIKAMQASQGEAWF